MGKFKRIIKNVFNELTKPKSYSKGEDFEEYLRDYIFTKDHYQLLQKTHDYSLNRSDYVESSLEPDYLFLSISSEKEFYVEAKFRSYFLDNAVMWCKPYQLKRYKEINRILPVFIALGVEGTPKYPEHLYIIPVKHIKYTNLFRSFLNKFEAQVDSPVNIKKLWSLLD